MDKYPKILIDETKNSPIDVSIEYNTERQYDFMHHTHKMSDIVNDIEDSGTEEETSSYDDTELRQLIEGKVDVVEGKSLVDDSEIERLSKVDNYDDAEIKKALKTNKFEIAKIPTGTLVRIREDEIRVMIPADTDFATQESAVNGAENMFYIENRVYAPEDAVRYKVNFGGTVTEGAVEDFAGLTDESGRIYLVVPLPVAYYNTESAAWVYYGASSTTSHYIGWDYVAEWYDADGTLMAADSVRINLSNEDCHFINEPYHAIKLMEQVGELSNYDDTEIKEALAAVVQYNKETAKADLVADHYVDRRWEPYHDEATNSFYANGVPITIEEDPDNSNGVIIKWGYKGSAKIADSTNLTVVGGGDGYITAKSFAHTKVTVNSGYVWCLFAGGCLSSVVDNAEIIINGGYVKNVYGGGKASDSRDGYKPSVVYNSKITVNGGQSNLLVGGSIGYGITENTTITINDGTFKWVVAGGTNGATEHAEVNINGGTIETYISSNRGYVTDVEFNMIAGSINLAYCGAEGEGEADDGTIESFKCNITGGIITTLNIGTDGHTVEGDTYVVQPMNIDKVSGHIADGVVTTISDELKAKLQ